MVKLFRTSIGRVRLLAFLEGISLLLLITLGIPLKYYFDDPSVTKLLGPVHGALFLLFVINTLQVSIEQQWKFWQVTWKILVACFIPFGTFYIDYKILRKVAVDLQSEGKY